LMARAQAGMPTMAVMTGKKPFAVSLRGDYPPIVDFWLFPGGLKDGAV